MSPIIVDTREQRPLFKNNVIRYKLEVGDYSTMNLRHSFAIERKSGQDLYGSLVQGHVRFMNEIYRAERLGIELVIFVECSYQAFTTMKFPGASRLQMDCEKLKKIVDTTVRRRKIEVVWCSSRDIMKRKVKERLAYKERILIQQQKILTKKYRLKKGAD
jgi:ERCC4-type nuclease